MSNRFGRGVVEHEAAPQTLSGRQVASYAAIGMNRMRAYAHRSIARNCATWVEPTLSLSPAREVLRNLLPSNLAVASYVWVHY